MVSLLLAVIYVAFISLGLPDAILGAAWPTMSRDIGAQISWAGGISMIISAGTICSALLSDRLTRRFGAGVITASSVALTAVALLGFSIAPNYAVLALMAIPYGLGAGGVDAALNNYVAIHYSSAHMSWLHCMWGIGASAGPYIMGWAMACGGNWATGYQLIGYTQIGLTLLIALSVPLFRRKSAEYSVSQDEVHDSFNGHSVSKPLSLLQVLRLVGAPQILIMFFCYCALEQTAGLWASSYMVVHGGVAKSVAVGWASLFYIGITVGRLISGFMTMRFDDKHMIRIGQCIIVIGVIILMLPLPWYAGFVVGFFTIGLGCAPIYPCIIHSTPYYFGADKSQAIVGMQMASAYVGSMLMPAIFGLIGQYIAMALLPAYLIALLVLMVIMHTLLIRVHDAHTQHNA